MINQNSEFYKKWLALQALNPPKIKGSLEVVILTKHEFTVKGRCCLGNACAANRITSRVIDSPYGEDFKIAYMGETGSLPPRVGQELNITGSVAFTDKGQRIVALFLREHLVIRRECHTPNSLRYLVDVNDSTEADHATIGLLIEHLAWVEREHKIEMFLLRPE